MLSTIILSIIINMSLEFSTTKLYHDNISEPFECIQTKRNLRVVSKQEKFPRCKICRSILFPLKNENYDCPICNPEAEYSPFSFILPSHAIVRRHFTLILDIMTPQKALYTFLMDLYLSMDDEDKASIVFFSDRITYIKVETSGLVHFHTCLNPLEVRNISPYSITRQQLYSYLLPSISSIYSLIPDELPERSDPYSIIEGVINSLEQRPSIILLTCARSVREITVNQSEKIGSIISDSNSVLHIATASDYRRLTSIVHKSYGTVFSISSVVPGNICGLLSASRTNDSTKIFASNSLRVLKIIGGTGKGRVSRYGMSITIPRFVGGSIQMALDPAKISSNQKVFHIIESHKTVGKKIISLHSFSISNTLNPSQNSENNSAPSQNSEGNSIKKVEIINTFLLKEFAERVLRVVWEGGNFQSAISKFKTPNINKIIQGSSIEKVGENLQIDILHLYYILLTYGVVDIMPKIQNSIKINLPLVIWDGKEGKEEIAKLIGNPWPYEFRYVDNINDVDNVYASP